MKTAAVLYARKNSIYKKFENFDVYDEIRDARNFPNDLPVIAHPPCRLFGKLKHLSKADLSEKDLAYHAVQAIKKCGGILEHPAYSTLWQEMELPLPSHLPGDLPGVIDYKNGFTLAIKQFDFGHKCQKNTWLYIYGIKPNELPSLPIQLGYAAERIGDSGSMKTREGTPIELALFMHQVAIKCDLRKAI